MKTARYILTLLALLVWGAAARADYTPPDPPEPGVDFTLTTSMVPSDGGRLNVGESQVYPFGKSVRLVAYPAAGFRFVGWHGPEGEILSASADYTFVMPARDLHVTALFRYDPDSPEEPEQPDLDRFSTLTLGSYPDEGADALYGEGTYEVGSQVRVHVYARTGFRFVNWTCDGVEVSTSADFRYTVPSGNPHLVANFIYDPDSPAEPEEPHVSRLLTLASSHEDSGERYGAGWHEAGSRVNVRTYVNKYHTFINWTDEEGAVVSESTDFYYTMPDRNVTLTANFSFFYDPEDPAEPDEPDIDHSVAPNTVYRPRFAMEGIDHVVIMCETAGVEMFYTLDGSVPDRNSTPYTGPVYVGSNLVVKAVAYKEGMYDSPVGTYHVTSYRAAEPTFSFEDFKVVIRCGTPGAVIRYTLDYTDPTEESPVYTEPFLPEEDCRVKAYASLEGLTDSNIAKYAFRRYDYTVKGPEFARTAEKTVEISCATPGAVIRYTLDGSDPTEESTLYAAPITLAGNCTIRAIAFREGFYTSPVTQMVIDDLTAVVLPTPQATYAAHHVALTCADAEAEILYTLDGSDPAENGLRYEGPVEVEADADFLFIARRDGCEDSGVGEYSFRIDDWRLPAPEFEPDFRMGWLYITAHRADMLVCNDKLLQLHEGTARISDRDLEQILGYEDLTVYSVSDNPDLYDSEEVFFEVNYYGEPQVSHNGSHLIFESESGLVKLGDQIIYSGGLLAPGLFTVGVRTVGEEKFVSREVRFENAAYFDIDAVYHKVPTAGCRHPDDLPKAFEFLSDPIMQTQAKDLETLCIDTPISEYSLSYVTERDLFPHLRTLDLEKTELTRLPDEFPFYALGELTLPTALDTPSDALEHLMELTTLRWKAEEGELPGQLLETAGNPNMLIWVNSAERVPSRDFNVVETSTNTARRLAVADNCSFRAANDFEALEAEYERTFSQTTPAPGEGNGYGWEAIALPFDVQSIEHESKGPVASFEALRNGAEGRPFWLYEADEEQMWRPAAQIRGGVPYIIAMPENDYYDDAYRLAGKVRFSAANVTVSSERTLCPLPDGHVLEPVLSRYPDIVFMGLNTGLDSMTAPDGTLLAPGSAFVDWMRPQPMHAGMNPLYGESYVPVFGEESQVGLLYGDDTLTVEAIDGTLRLTSGRDRTVEVYTTTGLCVATLHLQASQPQQTRPLSPGIYIAAGRKIQIPAP